MAVGKSVRYRGPQRKTNKFSFRTVCRAIFSHPFILVTLLYLIILHRYFPFLFSLLVSAVPVLIFTALLLGILLIHGQQSDHIVGNHDEKCNVTEFSNNGVGDYAYPFDKDGIFSREIFGEVRNDIVEKDLSVSRGFIGSDREYNDVTLSQSINQEQRSIPRFQFGIDIQDVPRHKCHAQKSEEKYDKTATSDSSFNHQKHIDSAADYESLDALVADVIPTPQETHPLLEFEDQMQRQTFRDGSHEVGQQSEVQSLDSNHSSEESDEETDYKDEEEDADEKDKNVDGSKGKNDDGRSPFAWTDDDQRILQELRSSEMEKNEHLESLISRAADDGSDELEDDDEVASIEDIDDEDVEVDVDDEEEDENLDVEKDGSKQVTLWTEEDEKNLRHLGCSELERNLRLENLLLRRRAKRNFSMISERNLIDLDHSDLPFPVAPISIIRVNPFDVTNDTSQHPSLPPIPGSAPSVTLPRKNPFDSPTTSPKRAQNFSALLHQNGSSTMENVSKPEFVETNRKEALFRRYESFSTGYNLIGDPPTHDFMDTDRRDFVFRRHETFNTRSVFPSFFSSNKPVFVPEHLAGEVRRPSLERQSSRDSESADSVTSSDAPSSTAPVSQEYEGQIEDDKAPIEGDHTSSHIETESESSEAIESLSDDQDEHDPESMEVNLDHIYEKQEVLHEIHQNSDDTSSSTSSLEHVASSVNESQTDEHAESSVNKSQIEVKQVDDSGFSSKGSLNISEISHLSIDDDGHHVDPVYDTSPTGVDKNTTFAHSTQV